VPQKQPPAKTAVCLPLLWARGLSLAGGGIGAVAAALHPVQAANTITRAAKVLRIAKELNIQTSVRLLRRTYATEVTSDSKNLDLFHPAKVPAIQSVTVIMKENLPRVK
jgi:hypothetical protein